MMPQAKLENNLIVEAALTIKCERDKFTRFIAAYESMRRRFGDEYQGRFEECDQLIKEHDADPSSHVVESGSIVGMDY